MHLYDKYDSKRYFLKGPFSFDVPSRKKGSGSRPGRSCRYNMVQPAAPATGGEGVNPPGSGQGRGWVVKGSTVVPVWRFGVSQGGS